MAIKHYFHLILHALIIVMKYAFNLPEFPDAQLEFESSIWTGKSTLWFDGMPYQRSLDEGKPFIIPISDGEIIRLYPKPAYPDLIPLIEVHGVQHRIAAKLPWYEYTIALLPFLIIFLGGGVIGGVISGGATVFNLQILRTEDSNLAKYIKLISVTFLTFVLYELVVHLYYQM